jgi:hypothetical protein
VLQTFLATLNYDFISSGGDFSSQSSLQNDFCKVNVIIDSRVQNIGRVEKQGLDFNVGYAPRLNGDFNLLTQLAVTHFLENDFAPQPGVPAESEIGELGGVSVFEWSGTAGVTALWRDFDAALVARYLDGMLATGQLGTNGLPGPDRNLSSYTQLDVTVGYSMDYGQSRALDGWRAQLAITNVADEEPDFFVDGGGAWSFRYGLPFGRTYALQLTTRF